MFCFHAYGEDKKPLPVNLYEGLSKELEDSLIKAEKEGRLRSFYVRKEAQFRNEGKDGDIINMSNWVEKHLDKDNIEGITLIYELRSAAYFSIGNYEAMFDDIEKSLDISKTDDLQYRDGVLYLWLMDFHMSNYKYDLAQQYLDKAKKFATQHENSKINIEDWKDFNYMIHLMQGQFHMFNGDWESAKCEFEEAEKHITGELHINGLNLLKFLFYKKRGEYEQADSIFQNHLKDNPYTPFCNSGIVKIEYVKLLLERQEFETAKKELKKIQPDSVHIRQRSSLYELTSHIYELEGNYKLAYHYLDKSLSLRDSLESEYKKVYANHAADRYEMRQVEKSLRKERLENLRNVVFILLLGSALIGSGMLVVIVIRRHRKRKRDQIIAEKNLGNRNAALSSAVMMADNYKNVCDDIKLIIGSDLEAKQKIVEINRCLKESSTTVEPLHHVSNSNDASMQEFMDKLRYVHPDLTNAELRMAQLIFMNISNKDIAEMQNRSLGTIKNQKYSLRKKLATELPMEQYLKQLSAASPSELEELAKKK